MSDSEQPEEEPTTEDLVAMLNDAEFLSEYGYRLTPKGHMGLVLMQHGVPHDLAAELSQQMSDRIFLAGYTYLSNEQLQLDFEVMDDTGE